MSTDGSLRIPRGLALTRFFGVSIGVDGRDEVEAANSACCLSMCPADFTVLVVAIPDGLRDLIEGELWYPPVPDVRLSAIDLDTPVVLELLEATETEDCAGRPISAAG